MGTFGTIWGTIVAVFGIFGKLCGTSVYTGLNAFVYTGLNAFVYTGLDAFVFTVLNDFVYTGLMLSYIQA